jgi:hypothetical protein
MLWLGDGIEGDDTDGHVDDLARFIDARTIVTAVEDDPRDANHEVLRENLRRLELLRGLDGRPFEIVVLPMPKRGGARRPAAAGHLPQLPVRERGRAGADVPGQEERRVALATLAKALPKHEVIGVDCTELISSGDSAPSTAEDERSSDGAVHPDVRPVRGDLHEVLGALPDHGRGACGDEAPEHHAGLRRDLRPRGVIHGAGVRARGACLRRVRGDLRGVRGLLRGSGSG